MVLAVGRPFWAGELMKSRELSGRPRWLAQCEFAAKRVGN